MKKTSNSLYLLIFLILGILSSCNSWNTSLGRRSQYQYTTQNPNPTPIATTQSQEPWWQDKEMFRLAAEHDTMLYTAGGTTLYYYGGTLLNANRDTVKGWVTLEVREAYTKGQMIFYNAPTVSNGRLLESGGEIQLKAFQNNEELQLDPKGRGMQVQMATIIKPDMELFSAVRDRQHNLNWVKDSLLIEENFDSQEDVEYLSNPKLDSNEIAIMFANGDVSWSSAEPSYYLFTTKTLGWINCDRFVNDSTEKTDFIVRIKTPMPEGQRLQAYLVFEEINSVMPAYSYDNGLTFTAANIPVGSKVKLVMLGEMDKTFYMDIQPLEISKGQAIWSSLNPYTKEGMKAVLDAL